MIGKAVRDGKTCYYINDGVYHTYSGVIFDHCKYPVLSFKRGATSICSVFGPTCDALDVVLVVKQQGYLVCVRSEPREHLPGRLELVALQVGYLQTGALPRCIRRLDPLDPFAC